MILGTWSELGQWGAASVITGPTAVITGDLSVNEGERAYLSAGTSIAGTYPIVSYQWVSLDGYTVNNPGASSADLDPSASVGGSAQVRLTVTDSEGNSDSTTVSIAVADITPPTITLNSANPLVLSVGDTWPNPSATVTDNVDGTRTIYAEESAPDMGVAGNGTLTFNATDTAGNVAQTVTQDYQIVADYSDIVERFALVSVWTIDGDGQITAFKGRRNREKFRFKPSDATGIAVDSEGYIDFTAPYFDRLEIIMETGKQKLSTDSNSVILVNDSTIGARLGDFGEITSAGSSVLTFVIYVGGDTQGTVIGSTAQGSSNINLNIATV